ncbi:metallophosphoesterase [Reichenbachiella agarivorans]|uniref:Metallophosphoesterase n=1 Tax=Reichenbachiella agarivorans TaxID=2979464 RepID=A0ABY6CK83_9BACT|nr:metallophosphoesterase [Reichenbachiella agarivorans]UXP30799.1 metallophosphoesterase [Reichenbachiella agarivorans]
MNRLVFLFFLFLAFVALDYYVFQAIRLLSQGQSTLFRTTIYLLYWSLTLLSIIGLLSWNLLDTFELATIRNFVATGIVMNLVFKLLAGIVVFFDDIIRFGKYTYRGIVNNGAVTQAAEGITRSEFLAKSAIVAGAIPVAVMGFGIVSGAYDYRVRRRTITLKNLPKAFDGIKIAQLSDIHSGSFYNKRAVKGGVDLMLAEKPDLFLFTGDLVNNESREVAEYVDIFSKAKAPLGQFSVLGNHDYGDYKQWTSPSAKQKNLQDLIQTHKNMGWDILLNEHRYVEVDGERLALIGIENWGKGRFAKYGDLAKAHQNVEADTKILLSHDPSHWDAQVRPDFGDIDLTLSGHTHGFQFGVEIGDFRWSPSQYLYKQWADLYQEGDQYLYVNRGFGFLGYPGRIGILPEITMLELKRA